MDIDFSGRVAIVTGAGGGLGKVYATQLAARGATVVVNDLGGGTEGTGGSSAPADAVVSQIRNAGGIAIAHCESVASRHGGESLVAAAMDHFGRVDVVINNAGNQRNNRFELMTDEEFDSVLNVHLKGAFYVSQPAYRYMAQQHYGRFLFTSSSSAMLGHYIRTNYSSAKAGLVGMMHSVALEGARHGILANALLPVAASRLGKAPPGMLYPEWEAEQSVSGKPGFDLIGPSVVPEYVAPLALYLCSERCTSTRAMWSAVGRRYARVFVGVTKGWLAPAEQPATPEEISEHLAQIEDRGGFDEPLSGMDEFNAVIELARQGAGR